MVTKFGEEGIWKYIRGREFDILSRPKKPINSISSSYANCEPSPKCSGICYAAKGHNFPANFLTIEAVNWAVEKDPIRAAKMTATRYMAMTEFEAQKALRFFDKGDAGGPNWIKYTEAVNGYGIRAQVFSKHPDFLRAISDYNLKLLSVDSSNVELGKNNPDLKLAAIFEGAQDLAYLEELGEDQIQVILPVNILQKKETPKQRKARLSKLVALLPAWAKKKTCPIDAGTKTIDNWNCTRCDAGTLMPGCFYGQSTKNMDALNIRIVSVTNR